VFQGNKHGFTLIELMLAMMIMGIMAGIMIPMIQQMRPQGVQREFARKFNELCLFAWQNALSMQKTHRIFFDFKKRLIAVQIESQPSTSLTKEADFKDVDIKYVNTHYTWPDQLSFKHMYINGQEKLQQAGVKVTTAWFYIIPDGLTQEVIINTVDNKLLDAQGAPVKMGLVVNPFTAQVKRYDAFQKP
jgi:prepilin-type N-terminal cleavage/methylation domain-containing protein